MNHVNVKQRREAMKTYKYYAPGTVLFTAEHAWCSMVKLKVLFLAVSGEYGGTFLQLFSVWATQLCKQSECYSWGPAKYAHRSGKLR